MAKRTIRGTPATPATYRKHRTKTWNRRTIRKTRSGDALFKPDLPLTPDQFALLYLDERINPIPADSDPDDVNRYWIKMDYVVGASNGRLTKYVLIKRDSGEVHARPVSLHELTHTFKVKTT